jgi:hypothetical protein
MAIVVENYYEPDGRLFKRTYSDRGFSIEQIETGFIFAEAIDPHSATWTYRETDDIVGEDGPVVLEDNLTDYSASDLIKAAKILLGEEE